MRHLQISLAVILLLFAFAAKPAIAERPCPGGVCKCAGTADCVQLTKSGQCNGPISCGSPGEQCGCVSKFKATTTSTIQKKPVSKSQ